MNTNIEAKIDEVLYINEATLELLRRRIEADVKKGFFTSIGAPIGGAGIIAILYVLFSWIPAQLGTMIEDMPGIQRTVQESAIDYLENEQKGQRFIRQQVDLNSEKFVHLSDLTYDLVHECNLAQDNTSSLDYDPHRHLFRIHTLHYGFQLIPTL